MSSASPGSGNDRDPAQSGIDTADVHRFELGVARRVEHQRAPQHRIRLPHSGGDEGVVNVVAAHVG